jgi:hypothetical protein
MTDAPKEHRAIALLAEYDALKSRVWWLEQELNKACVDFGLERFNQWGYAPQHLRAHLRAMETVKERERDLHGSTSSPSLA